MALPTQNDVHPVDPVLSNLLVGYIQSDTRFVAGRVFPYIDVTEKSGTFFTFSKKYWFLNEMQKRAPGSKFARAGFGVETATYSTEQFALEHLIPDEVVAANQVPMSHEQAGLRWLAQQALIKAEVEFATDFMKTGVWGTDNTSATDWNDFSAGDPVNDILTARKTISDNTGMDANTMVLGLIVHNALLNHPDVIDRIKYTTQATQGAIEGALASLLGVQNYIVGRASYNTANEGQAFSTSAIIDDDCLIGVVNATPDMLAASLGYTFAWAGGGGRGSVSQYYDDSVKSSILQATAQWDQSRVASDVGYFFEGIV